MLVIITVLHVIMCVLLIGIVLLQSGKGASMGAAFGGGSNTIFGGAGPANFLNKITTVAAIVFMITSFVLALLSSSGGTSSKVLDVTPAEQTQPATDTETTAPVTGEAEESGAETTVPADETSQESTGEEAPAAASNAQDTEQPSE